MKKFLTILFTLFISQIIFSQTQALKYAEYNENGFGCDNYFRYADFRDALLKDDGNKGLVVIFAGDEKERFGNVLGYVSGAKEFATNWLGIPTDRISIVISKGKTFFAQEFWIIPKNAELPYIESFNYEWSNLQSKYYFSNACFQCEPSYGLLTSSQPNLDLYAKILKENLNYQGQIIVRNFDDIANVTNKLTKEAKLPRNRYIIKFQRQKKLNDFLYSVDFYLLPKLAKNK